MATVAAAAFLGPRGTLSEEAAVGFTGDEGELVAFGSFPALTAAVETGGTGPAPPGSAAPSVGPPGTVESAWSVVMRLGAPSICSRTLPWETSIAT